MVCGVGFGRGVMMGGERMGINAFIVYDRLHTSK